ncbi:DUF2809 domain-containing protein [Paenibacillus methanolicus]|uniref:Uncharacterized protein DUF2809 n=1 Tax=Paenibacillus methanolicus TaxID=582686 RepID=A0A5S5BWS4_9BACL|nr:DUF2809 domain-containing protein [Paenibacillus methanolicus]TYP70083.1 uncharacterized protein DUF2809 [Paenibacillus methanolicus]
MRPRFAYAAAIAALVLLGLASRRFADALPTFVASHAGDALWAAMAYAGFRFLLARKPVAVAAACSAVFAAAIEFSQLYQAPWINAARETTLGALVLGRGFLAVDLLRYAAGIAVAAGVDLMAQRRRT